MNQEIKSQINRAKELLGELKESCNKDLASKTVSDKTRNLTQEVLVKMGSVFDQAIRLFFKQKVEPELAQEEKKRAKVYFPFAKDLDSLKSILGRGKMAELESKYPEVFGFLQSVQPFIKGYKWMHFLKKYADERHIELTPQKKTVTDERITVAREGVGTVSWKPKGVKFENGVSILEAPIDTGTQNIRPTAGVTSKREIWVSFTLGDSGVNSLWLCETAINEGEKIISSFLGLF